jgi:hypothetical protein
MGIKLAKREEKSRRGVSPKHGFDARAQKKK